MRPAKLPITAVWTTLKSHPFWKIHLRPIRPTKKIVAYEQRGTVWQAEEIRSGNTWKRYFGFVGRHTIAKVPAEEIDFPWEDADPTLLDSALEGAVIPMRET